MDKKELLQAIKERRKGKIMGAVASAEILDGVLDLAESIHEQQTVIAELTKTLTQDKAILSDVNTFFPVLYREAKRIFNKPKEKKEI